MPRQLPEGSSFLVFYFVGFLVGFLVAKIK